MSNGKAANPAFPDYKVYPKESATAGTHFRVSHLGCKGVIDLLLMPSIAH
jgi:hypothetical protein